jgi:hypothetical protein
VRRSGLGWAARQKSGGALLSRGSPDQRPNRAAVVGCPSARCPSHQLPDSQRHTSPTTDGRITTPWPPYPELRLRASGCAGAAYPLEQVRPQSVSTAGFELEICGLSPSHCCGSALGVQAQRSDKLREEKRCNDLPLTSFAILADPGNL